MRFRSELCKNHRRQRLANVETVDGKIRGVCPYCDIRRLEARTKELEGLLREWLNAYKRTDAPAWLWDLCGQTEEALFDGSDYPNIGTTPHGPHY